MWKPEWPRHLLKVLGLALLSSVAGSDCGSSIPHPPRMPSATLSRASLITEIAFGSCYVPQFERSEIWHAIASSNPDVFLFLGDNVYQSEEKGEPELLELREAYALLARDEPFAALRSRIPVLTTWDDHDYGLDNAGAEFAAKYQSEALFEEVWAIPASDPRKSRDGIYHRRIVGPMGRRVQMILLDTRFFRTSPESENSDALEPTMLGVEQWRKMTRANHGMAGPGRESACLPCWTERLVRSSCYPVTVILVLSTAVLTPAISHCGSSPPARSTCGCPKRTSTLTATRLGWGQPTSKRILASCQSTGRPRSSHSN